MLLDARSIAAGETMTTDVCIVGAGAAGIATALGLLDAPGAGTGCTQRRRPAALARLIT